MKAEILKIKGTWRDVADAARTTIGMEPGRSLFGVEKKTHSRTFSDSQTGRIVEMDGLAFVGIGAFC